MKKGDLVRFKDDGSYGIITAICRDGKYAFIEWVDGKLGWHLIKTKRLELVYESR